MVAKTDSPNFYKPPAYFAVVKRTLRTCASHPPSLLLSKRTLRTSTSLHYIFGVVKTQSPNFYKSPTPFVVVKMDSPNLYKPPTRFRIVKTQSPNFYKPPTPFAVVKTDPEPL